jgi:hypothetical protein
VSCSLKTGTVTPSQRKSDEGQRTPVLGNGQMVSVGESRELSTRWSE